MKLILLGPPGAGKGTQAVRIAARLGIAHISTGDMLRAEIRNDTPLGRMAKAILDKGELVSDDVIIGMVKNRIAMSDCARGFLFDGFPRTVAQAEALETITQIDHVINIEVQLNRLIDRISSRRMCPDCGGTYHVSQYPDGVCPCGGKLYQRDDDREETVKNRLTVYEQKTAPLIAFYQKQGNLFTVNGDASIDQVELEISEKLGA
ncbi:MAG: adenylate kinase [Eubacteriales bacterium]|nr:adenylate kinase [Eubacteriales bacterium]